MNYNQALEYLAKLGLFGIKPGLERMNGLLLALGNPQHKLRYVHITGTNGKGSTSSMIAMLLAEHGYRVGKFTSPHLVRYNERISINEVEISDEEFSEGLTLISEMARTLPDDSKPTQFEVLTALAFYYFAKQRVNYVVLEVGLGGLLDSTNVITPLCSVITNVTLDHMDKCGYSVAEIAKHKAGIIKNNVPVVTAASREALTVIADTAKCLDAPLYIYGEDFATQALHADISGQKFIYEYNDIKLEINIKLLGRHQLENAALAITALYQVLPQTKIDQHKVIAAMDKVRWAGRSELIAAEPYVILDGAHNIAGAAALRSILDEYFPARNICFILGFMQDKQISEIINILCKDTDTIIAVTADEHMPRSATPEHIKRATDHKVMSAASHAEAIALAKSQSSPSDVICIAGSLYLVGKIKQMQQDGLL